LALIRPDIVAAVQKALGQLMEGRAREGARLCQDMMSKLLLLRQLITECTERAPIVAQQYRDKLRAKLSDLLERVDESRLITEMAVMLERQSIDEELVRIQSHVLEFEEAIHGGSPVGRRLDFIVQEMNREMNTIGSKTTDIQVTKAVVEAKVLIEQLREQAQNIE
jgi:uncharacterized protein (TIGR00255 family)